MTIFFGVFYISKYRDINGLTWLLIDGTTYKQKVSSNFKFKNKNLITIEFNRNIIYQLEFELYPYKSNEQDIIEFENMMKHIKNTKIYIYKKILIKYIKVFICIKVKIPHGVPEQLSIKMTLVNHLLLVLNLKVFLYRPH